MSLKTSALDPSEFSRIPGRLGEVVKGVFALIGREQVGHTADPDVIAAEVSASKIETLAALNVLRKHHIGSFRLQVIDDDGSPIASFPSRADVPPTVTDSYGETITVDNANLRVVFQVGEASAASG